MDDTVMPEVLDVRGIELTRECKVTLVELTSKQKKQGLDTRVVGEVKFIDPYHQNPDSKEANCRPGEVPVKVLFMSGRKGPCSTWCRNTKLERVNPVI